MNDAQSLRDLSELLQQLSAATGLSKDAIQNEVDNLDYAAFQFNDAILVSPSDFEGIIDSWAAKLKADLRLGSSTIPAKPKATTRKTATAKTTKTSPKKAAKTVAKAPKKTATKTTATKKAATKTTATKTTATKKAAKAVSKGPGSLPLPEDYRSIVSHLYGPSLKRIMPEDEAAQKAFLEAIANETDAGVELLNHLSVIIAEKYTGKMAPASAYNGLKNKAVVLLNGGVTTTKKTRGRKPGKKPGRKPGRPAATKSKPGRKPTKGRKSKAAAAKKLVSASPTPKTSVAFEMELPKGYRKHVSNRYGPTLKSLLPNETELRSAYLKEIISESTLGKSFLERVADSIKIKYRGKITSHTAYQGLLSKAQAM